MSVASRGENGGLCPSCTHVKRIESARGSTFFMCRRALRDVSFAKYPPQPRWACLGYEERDGDGARGESGGPGRGAGDDSEPPSR